ncbi:MAG: MFS transporter [Spirochaetaceae bacterium]|jgi:predicted MFS family arabinose efflux permease|nr:MFS transporter [Spirochaetaceae bacterium]
MDHKSPGKAFFICLIVFIFLSGFLFLNREELSPSLWKKTGALVFPVWAGGNGTRTAVIENSARAVSVIDSDGTLLYRLAARRKSERSFTTAQFAELDEMNNLYVLDANFRGVERNNIERILKYSADGTFQGELYSYKYRNDDFIITKGKIGGMAYYGGQIYLAKLEDDGFRIEKISAEEKGELETIAVVSYPNAFRDLGYFGINVRNRMFVVTTKAGHIRQYNFDGTLAYEWTVTEEDGTLPWTVVSDHGNNLIFTDIVKNEIASINVSNGVRSTIASFPKEHPCYRINYNGISIFAASGDGVFIKDAGSGERIINSYFYSNFLWGIRLLLLSSMVLEGILFLALLFMLFRMLSIRQSSKTMYTLVQISVFILFGSIISTILIVNEMSRRYEENAFTGLENISRLMANKVDTDVLNSLSSPVQYETGMYLDLKESLKSLFRREKFHGERIYQIIWMVRDGKVCAMYDLENSLGIFMPRDEYTQDSYYHEVFDTGSYVHRKNVATSSGSWLFVCGPIFDTAGNITALIETGYNMLTVQEDLQRNILIILTLVLIISISMFLAAIVALYYHAKHEGKIREDKKNYFEISLTEKRFFFGFLAAFAVFSVVLVVNRHMISPSPWESSRGFELPYHAIGNGERIAVVENSKQTVIVLSSEGELLYRLNAGNGQRSFSAAEQVELDEENNLYILDINFGGVQEESVEKIVKYSKTGTFLGEVYAYHYINEDFINTKGKISGIGSYDGSVYVVRLEHDGFLIERARRDQKEDPERIAFVDYPNAFRDLGYCHINPEKERLAITTKAGGIRQFSFDGSPVYEWTPGEKGGLPWSVVSDDSNNFIYSDIITNEIAAVNTLTGERNILLAPEGTYYRSGYKNGLYFAVGDDILIREGDAFHSLDSYYYPSKLVYARMAVSALCLLTALVFLGLSILSIRLLLVQWKKKTFRRILIAGLSIALGTVVSSVIIIRSMNALYNENTFSNLENVSRLLAAEVDTAVLSGLDSPAEYDNEEYLRLKDSIKEAFLTLQFKGARIYQTIWKVSDGMVYLLNDLENSVGCFHPFYEYTGDDPAQVVFDTKQYVHVNNMATSEGVFIFVDGPIFDDAGNVVAIIETGYDLGTVNAENKKMIVQIILIVVSAAIAIFLIMLEFILISEAHKKSKIEYAEDTTAVFHPELLRAVIFVLFFTGNLATALLPMYASNLYQPLFGLPREFIVTLPFITDMVFAALALFVIPAALPIVGIKRIGVSAAFMIVLGNVLCFIASNTAYLAVAYALTGFSTGALILVLNTIIGARKQVEEVNSGFAHFTASYLAGMNVGVVVGSILAQFFPYRIIYFVSSVFSILLVFIMIYSVKSNALHHLYAISYFKERRKHVLLKFIFRPIVLCTLLLLLLPFMVSQSFVNYFMPLFGFENGLKESNIGQILMLNGLLAILFGTALCKYAAKKFPIKAITIASLVLNLSAIFVFTLNMTIPMLIVSVLMLAIANIFASTNMQTYYATLYQGTRMSSVKALGIYSAVENLSMAIGPVVFSYILTGTSLTLGLRIVAAALLLCLIVFVFVSKKTEGQNPAERKE